MRLVSWTVIASAAALLVVSTTPAEAWMKRVDPTGLAKGGRGWQPASLSKIDSSGDVILVGAPFRLAKYSGETGALIWQTSTPSDGFGRTLEIDGAHDIFLIGSGQIFKFDGATGALLWRITLGSYSVALDPSGDLFALTAFWDGQETTLSIRKFDGSNGAQLWSTSAPGYRAPGYRYCCGAPFDPHDFSVTPDGDVIVALSDEQTLPNYVIQQSPVFLSLNGSDGSQQWIYEANTFHNGDAGTVLGVVGSSNRFFVELYSNGHRLLAIDTTSGALVWNQEIVSPTTNNQYPSEILLDPSGDVVLAGHSYSYADYGTNYLYAAKYASGDGSRLWLREIRGNDLRPGLTEADSNSMENASTAATDASGNVFLGGALWDGEDDLAVLRLAAADGAIEWWRLADGTAPPPYSGCDLVRTISVRGDGHVRFVGEIGYADIGICSAVVASIDEATGALNDMPVGIDRLTIQNSANPAAKRISLLSSGVSTFPPGPNNVGDPRCDAPGGGGANLSVFSTGGATSNVSIPLPCENWVALGDPAHPIGYEYEDREQLDGPCSSILLYDKLRKGRLSIRCSGANPASPLDYDLDAMGQGSVALRLELPETVYCAEATPSSSAIGADSATSFRAAKGSAPLACPVP